MRMRLFFLASAIAVADVAFAGQHDAHQGAATMRDAAQAAQCGQAQSVVSGLVDAAIKRVEEARLSNNAAAMRDAVDDLQAALVDIKQQLTPCGQLAAATAAGHAGHVMPNTQQAAAAAPGIPATQPRSPAPAPGAVAPQTPAPAAADHAGHATATPAKQPAAPRAASPAAPARPAASTAHDAHAGHAAPDGPAAATRPRPAETPRAARAADHAGHAAPAAPAGDAAASRAGLLPAPPTDVANLKCRSQVDPKTAPRMLHQGRMYYFCSEQDRSMFAKDPSKYALTSGEAAPAHAH